MAKAGELDWSEELNKACDYKHVPTALWAMDQAGGKEGGIDLLNKAKKINEEGEIPRKPTDEEIANYILKGVIGNEHVGQWRDEDHLHKEVVTQEQAEELQKNWENIFQNFYDAANAPVNQSNQEEDWGTGKSFNDSLTEAERLRRNMHTDD